jgi:hypothetical protein
MKRYEEVKLEIIAFEESNVITTSNPIETPILGEEEEDIEY